MTPRNRAEQMTFHILERIKAGAVLSSIMDLIEANLNEAIVQARDPEIEDISTKLLIAMDKLEEFADYELDPKYACWPKSDYMKQSRETLEKIRKQI